jgi:hypothetical protein
MRHSADQDLEEERGRPVEVMVSGYGNCGNEADSLEVLATWLRNSVAQGELTHHAIAARIWQHRTGVSRALSGTSLPTWEVTKAIVGACGADESAAARLRAAAQEATVIRARRAADEWPPDRLGDHGALCRALGTLVRQRGLSLRELVGLDNSKVLTRSMVNYVLHGQRALKYDVMSAIVAACGTTPEAAAAWDAAWHRLAALEIAARKQAQIDGLRAVQNGRLYSRRWFA